MILIADSGSTKSDWVGLHDNGEKVEFATMGFNPFIHSEQNIVDGLRENQRLVDLSSEVETIHYYGAGCSSDDLRKIVKDALAVVFPKAQIYVTHDALASAYATYNGEPGISCILGTGSNSCYFDGENVSEVVPALGYIMGDEASGSYFGKMLLRDFLYKKMPQNIAVAFKEKYNLNKEEILESVLSKPFANVYLASFAAFLEDFRNETYIHDMLLNGFAEFIRYHIQCFDNYDKVPVHFIGSIAHFYKKELLEAAQLHGINVGSVIRKPIYGLVNYHLQFAKSA